MLPVYLQNHLVTIFLSLDDLSSYYNYIDTTPIAGERKHISSVIPVFLILLQMTFHLHISKLLKGLTELSQVWFIQAYRMMLNFSVRLNEECWKTIF